MKPQTEDHPRPGYHEFLCILKKKTLKAEKRRAGPDCSEIQWLCFLQRGSSASDFIFMKRVSHYIYASALTRPTAVVLIFRI